MVNPAAVLFTLQYVQYNAEYAQHSTAQYKTVQGTV